MSSSISVNLSVPSSTGGMSVAFCSHPMSSAEPRTVRLTFSIRLVAEDKKITKNPVEHNLKSIDYVYMKHA